MITVAYVRYCLSSDCLALRLEDLPKPSIHSQIYAESPFMFLLVVNIFCTVSSLTIVISFTQLPIVCVLESLP